MSVHSTGSSRDIDYMEEDPLRLPLPLFHTSHHKEAKLKVVPLDVTYATFANMGPGDIYDKISSIVHFGHISNRILRKLLHAGFLDPSCSNTMGKNRKQRIEQRRLFEAMSNQGVVFLHKVIKSELEGVDIKDDVPVSPARILGNKRAVSEVMAINSGHSSSSSSTAPLQPAAKLPTRAPESLSRADILAAILEAFNSSKAQAAAAATVARENAERKQSAVKFLQDQLKEGNKLSSAKRKEFEGKLEELLGTICAEL